MAFMSVDEQMKILMRGVVDLVSEEELRQKLERSVKTGRPLRVKLGIDPTGKDLPWATRCRCASCGTSSSAATRAC